MHSAICIASGFVLSPLSITAIDSVKEKLPSVGSTKSIGKPFNLSATACCLKPKPIATSPARTFLSGAEPEFSICGPAFL